MDRSQTSPVLSVRDADNGVGEYTGAPSGRSAVVAESIARELIGIRSLKEGEELVIGALLSATGLDWGALYRFADDTYRLSNASHPHAGKVPKSLAGTVVTTILDGVRLVGGCSDKDIGLRLRGCTLVVRLESEFTAQPAILILGSSNPEARLGINLRSAEAIADISAAGLRNLELLERLRSEVFVDFLTLCYNRRAFEEHLTVELVRAKRYERPLCLLLIDLDDFKDINDILGHQAGDYVLARIGGTLRAAFRTTDRVCRYGGDEFAVIFPETPKEEVLRLAERLRRQISTIFPDAAVPSAVTASIGVASFPLDGTRSEDLIRAADQAMYRAKEAGRNKVIPA